jgi:hypothetical protein
MAAAAAVAAGVAALTGAGCATARAGASDGGAGPLEDGATGFPEDAGTGIEGNEDATSGATFYGAPGIGDITCMTSAGCLPGQLCCGTLNLTTSCQAGPCSSGFQLCGVSAECVVAGDTCESSPIVTSLGVMIMTCNAPSDDGGSPGDGSSGPDGGGAADSSSSDGDRGDAAMSDALTISGD